MNKNGEKITKKIRLISSDFNSALLFVRRREKKSSNHNSSVVSRISNIILNAKCIESHVDIICIKFGSE